MSERVDPSSDRRGPRRRLLRRLGAALGAFTLLPTCFVAINLVLLSSDNPLGHWRTQAARAAFERLYAEAMRLLPDSRTTHDLDTDFGTVRAYVFAREDAGAAYHARTPLVLLPGRLTPAPVWHANVHRMMRERPVIALDALGEPGMSVQTAPIGSPADQRAWIEQALAALGIGRVHVAGVSLGGWHAMNHAVHVPERTASLSLVDPPYVFAGVSATWLAGGVLTAFPLMPAAYDRLYARWTAGGSDSSAPPELVALLDHCRRHFAVVAPPPTRFDESELRSVEQPVLLVLAGRSVAHDPAAAAAGSRSVKDLTLVVETEGSHAVHAQHGERIDQLILSHAATHEPG